MGGEVAKGIREACSGQALQKRKLNKKTIDVDVISYTQIKGCTTSKPHSISGGTKKLDRGQNQTFISVSVRSIANLKKKQKCCKLKGEEHATRVRAIHLHCR